jgi:hypothetical protein
VELPEEPLVPPPADWLVLDEQVVWEVVLLHLPPPELGGKSGSGAAVRGCVVVPLAVVTCAEVASSLPGHQATSHPLATVAWTSSPSLRRSVTPVTVESTWPSTNV